MERRYEYQINVFFGANCLIIKVRVARFDSLIGKNRKKPKPLTLFGLWSNLDWQYCYGILCKLERNLRISHLFSTQTYL